MFRLRIIYGLLAFASIFLGCSDSETQTIAKWKSIQINNDVFKTSYVRYLSSAPLKDSFEHRKKYSRTLLERKVISFLAQEYQYDTLSTVKNAILQAQGLAAIKHFIRDQVHPKISKATETEIRNAFRRKHTNVNLQQIFAPNREIAFRTYNELLNDSSKFEELAMKSMINAGESPQSFKMGWVSWNDMDLEPEIAAFALQENEISKPVQSLQGWHIFKLVGKRETFFADNITFQNSRESLETELEKRKFEEHSIRYINSVLNETPLELYPSNISFFWSYLEPILPDTDDQLKLYLNSNPELNNLKFNPREIILARLEGNPITAEHFLNRMSSIPFWQLKGNMRAAVETIAKDILFSKMAEEAGYYSNQEVIKETEIERTRILYNTLTSAVADTIIPEKYQEYWYLKYGDNYIKDRVLNINLYNFSTEQEARVALQSFKEKGNWEDALTENPNFKKKENIQLNHSSNAEHPAFSINYNPESLTEIKLWGPFPINEQWSFVEILEKQTVLKSFEEVKPDLVSDISANLPSLVHSILLEKAEFDSSEVHYNNELLNTVLHYYFN